MKAIKVDDETYELLQKLAEQTKLSIKEIASRSIKAYYTGMSFSPAEKEVEKIEEKLITLKYPAKCNNCRKELRQGELAFWQRYTFNDKSTKSRILCLECYYNERTRDETLVKLFLKKKETEKLVKALRKEADKLASKIQDLQFAVNIFELRRKLDIVIDHLEKVFDNKEELEKIKNEIREMIDKISEMEEFARTFILPKYIKKVVKKTEIRGRRIWQKF